MSILDTYGTESYQPAKDQVQLAILKVSNGKIERLRNFVATAQGDYRDLLLIAQCPNQFRVETMADGASKPELAQAEEQDQDQYAAWLYGNENIFVCETCCGVGTVLDDPIVNDSTAPNGLRFPKWIFCRDCQGNGTFSQ